MWVSSGVLVLQETMAKCGLYRNKTKCVLRILKQWFAAKCGGLIYVVEREREQVLPPNKLIFQSMLHQISFKPVLPIAASL